MGLQASVLPVFFLAMAWPAVAVAHGLVVFATVDGDEVVVEAKFPGGEEIKAGEVRVIDAEGREILRLPVAPDGVIRFPLDPAAEAGLRIEVKASNGHENFWILTPGDIAAGRGEAGVE